MVDAVPVYLLQKAVEVYMSSHLMSLVVLVLRAYQPYSDYLDAPDAWWFVFVEDELARAEHMVVATDEDAQRLLERLAAVAYEPDPVDYEGYAVLHEYQSQKFAILAAPQPASEMWESVVVTLRSVAAVLADALEAALGWRPALEEYAVQCRARV